MKPERDTRTPHLWGLHGPEVGTYNSVTGAPHTRTTYSRCGGSCRTTRSGPDRHSRKIASTKQPSHATMLLEAEQ